jgi:hypothetical protein
LSNCAAAFEESALSANIIGRIFSANTAAASAFSLLPFTFPMESAAVGLPTAQAKMVEEQHRLLGGNEGGADRINDPQLCNAHKKGPRV